MDYDSLELLEISFIAIVFVLGITNLYFSYYEKRSMD